MKKLIILALTSIVSSQAIAQDPALISELDAMVEEAKGLIPEGYKEALELRKEAGGDGFAEAFPNMRDQADCKFGMRFGKQLATSVLRRLKPSCDDLLATTGLEWLPPVQEDRTEAFGRCFDNAFSWTATQIVYDTAESCAWSGFEGSLSAAQAMYNECYGASAVDGTFVEDPFVSGSYALIPRNSEHWNDLLAQIRSNYGAQTGYISLVCEAGKNDAIFGRPPRNILKLRED